MAFPFGGHPTLAAYMLWIRDSQGGKAESGYAADSKGKTHLVTKITTGAGKTAVVVGIKQTDHLVPTMVGYLDRRLGVTSPWFAVDLQDPH